MALRMRWGFWHDEADEILIHAYLAKDDGRYTRLNQGERRREVGEHIHKERPESLKDEQE